jgi:hypothetical protein
MLSPSGIAAILLPARIWPGQAKAVTTAMMAISAMSM